MPGPVHQRSDRRPRGSVQQHGNHRHVGRVECPIRFGGTFLVRKRRRRRFAVARHRRFGRVFNRVRFRVLPAEFVEENAFGNQLPATGDGVVFVRRTVLHNVRSSEYIETSSDRNAFTCFVVVVCILLDCVCSEPTVELFCFGNP